MANQCSVFMFRNMFPGNPDIHLTTEVGSPGFEGCLPQGQDWHAEWWRVPWLEILFVESQMWVLAISTLEITKKKKMVDVIFWHKEWYETREIFDYYIIEIAIQHLTFKSDRRYETMESEPGKLESPWPCLRRDLLTSSSWTLCWPKARSDDKCRRTWYNIAWV